MTVTPRGHTGLMSLVVADFAEFGDTDLPDGRYAAADELARRLQNLERDVRFCEARIAAVLDEADRLGVYSIDGHRDIRAWAAANVNWSRRETLERSRTVTLLRDLPELAEDLKYGEVGVAQVRELARVRANPRCGDQVVEAAPELVELAKRVSFEEFRIVTQRWEQLNDTDGAHRGHEAAHAGRRVSTSMFDDTFHLAAQFGAVQGAAIAEILKRFENAEFAAEWDALKAVHGDDMCTSMMERTHSQRRADALYAIFMAAVAAPPGAQVPEPVVNIIVDQDTFDAHMAAAASGEPAPPRDPAETGGRCETDTGIVVDPAVAVAAAIVGHVRRVVMNSASVVTDLGRKQRVFTGGSRTAVFLQDGRRCIWPGCGHDFRTQIDHSTDWQHHGVTAPCNGGPLCAFHNRFKNFGYHVHRDSNGHWHTHRPDGTEIHPI